MKSLETEKPLSLITDLACTPLLHVEPPFLSVPCSRRSHLCSQDPHPQHTFSSCQYIYFDIIIFSFCRWDMVSPPHVLLSTGWELQGLKKQSREDAGAGSSEPALTSNRAVPGERQEGKVQQPLLSGPSSCECLASAVQPLASQGGQGWLLPATSILQPSVVPSVWSQCRGEWLQTSLSLITDV